MFLALEPAGPGQLEEDPRSRWSRTASAYDVVEAFTAWPTRRAIDTEQLTESLTTLATDVATPRTRSRRRCAGCPGSPQTVASRDEQINDPAEQPRTVTGVAGRPRPGHRRS